MSLRKSRPYKLILWALTLACLGGAGYLAYRVYYAPVDPGRTLQTAEAAYQRGDSAFGQKNWAEAATRFDEARLLSDKAMDELKKQIDEKKITPEAVTLRSLDGGAVIEQAADLVVLATGYDPAVELRDALAERGIDVRPAGDAVAPLLLPHAIASGREVGRAV